jgi:hypothetical protein
MMEKEDYIELLERFVKHIKRYAADEYEWTIEDMEINYLFEIGGVNLKEEFEKMMKGVDNEL